jgi:lipoyl(octanoyl) transferase
MIQYLYLGRVAYGEALALQQEVAALRLAGRIANTLLLLEHPPVLTLGRNAQRANILASDELLAQRGVTLHEINRGGDVTYHGPGQLVGYPIFDLRSLHAPGGNRLGPVDFVRLMEEALIRLCAEHGIPAVRIPGLTGVWCGTDTNTDRKIAAIGIHVSRGIVTHGFAFNLSTTLDDFRLIVPCGITDREVTSLEAELRLRDSAATVPALESVAHQTARIFGAIFGEQILALESLAALRALAEASIPLQQ